MTTTFNAKKVRFGGTVVFNVQLQGTVGDATAGVNGIDPAQWNLSAQVTGQPADVDELESGPGGEGHLLDQC